MIDRLFIPKNFNSYADTFLMLGLAYLVESALKATKQKTTIQLIDKGTAYVIQFKKAVNIESISELTYSNPFPPVKGKNTDISKIPAEVKPFDTVEEGRIRKLYREFLFQQRGKTENREESPKPPDYRTQNGVFLTSMRCDRNHNKLWFDCWELRENYGFFIAALSKVLVKKIRESKLLGSYFTNRQVVNYQVVEVL